MMVATMGAMTLGRRLRKHPSANLTGLPRRFQRALAKEVQVPWQLAIAADYRVPVVEGETVGWATMLSYRYLDGLAQILPTTPFAHRTFVEVTHLLKPSTALFHPAIAWKVLQQGLVPRKKVSV
jgi:hypothetical protein